MADFKRTRVGETTKHVTFQAIWTATTTESQNATVLIDLANDDLLRDGDIYEIDRLSIEMICGTATLPAQRSIFLLDSENKVIAAVNSDTINKIYFKAGGLRGTKELSSSADGSLYIAMGQSIASNGTASGTVTAGVSYSIQVQARKLYKADR